MSAQTAPETATAGEPVPEVSGQLVTADQRKEPAAGGGQEAW